jgi:HK97 family phage prohead protease
MTREYEIASEDAPLQYSQGGFITTVGYKPATPTREAKLRSTPEYLQGYAIRWDTPIHLGAFHYVAFAPDSIKTPMLGKPKRLHFDHDESQTIATTDDGLILRCDEYGLAMRWLVGDTTLGRKVAHTVRTRERDALSVGVIMGKSIHRNKDHREFRYVQEATLNEVSLVAKGACEPAFCQLVDVHKSRTLEEDCKSMQVLFDGAFAGVMRALKALKVH